MTADELTPGLIVEVDLPPTWDGSGLAGTHPVVVLGICSQTGYAFGVACTSNPHCRGKTYCLSRDATGLPRDSYVLVTRIRDLEPGLVRRARRLGRVPGALYQELKDRTRAALRRRNLLA